jgi:hypothetical protein
MTGEEKHIEYTHRIKSSSKFSRAQTISELERVSMAASCSRPLDGDSEHRGGFPPAVELRVLSVCRSYIVDGYNWARDPLSPPRLPVSGSQLLGCHFEARNRPRSSLTPPPYLHVLLLFKITETIYFPPKILPLYLSSQFLFNASNIKRNFWPVWHSITWHPVAVYVGLVIPSCSGKGSSTVILEYHCEKGGKNMQRTFDMVPRWGGLC